MTKPVAPFSHRPVSHFEYEHWHVWEVCNGFSSGWMLSDESVKRLRQFKTADDVVNFLYLNDAKQAARAFNAHVKG